MDNMLIGDVTNGQYKKTDASNAATKANNNVSTSKSKGVESNGYNEEMFLKLLVAEMQYQDPMEPTNNSEYVAQLASFTQIEAIQSVQKDMANMEANSMVGKFVSLVVDNQEIHGKVEYVRTDDDGKIWASIKGKEYELEKIDSVVDENYYNAVTNATTIMSKIAAIPRPENLTLGDESKIVEAVNLYNSADDYTKSYIDEDAVKYLKAAIEKFDELKKEKEKADNEVKNGEDTTSETAVTVDPIESTEEASEETIEEAAEEAAESSEVTGEADGE